MKSTKPSVKWMIKADLPAVMKIEKQTSDPKDTEWFIDQLKNNKTIALTVTESDLIGYLVYKLHDKYYEIKRIVVDNNKRRRGYGRLMINNLKHKLYTPRRKLIANVPESLLHTQLFLKSNGFLATRIKVVENDVLYKMIYVNPED